MVLVRRHEGYWRKHAAAARAGLKRWLPWVSVIGIGVTILLVSEHNIAPKFRDCVSNISRQQAAKDSDKNRQIVASIVGTQTICTISLIDRHNGFFSFLTALAVAFFTGTLWVTSNRQADLTRESIDLGNREFISSHRPRIAVRGIYLIIQKPDTGDVVIRFNIHNTGSSKAKVTDIKMFISGRANDTIYYPSVAYKEPSLPHEIEGGFDFQALCECGADLAEITRTGIDFINKGWSAAAFERENVYVHFRIIVFYEDVIGGRRQTSAHRQFDFKERRFTRIEGSEFEYED